MEDNYTQLYYSTPSPSHFLGMVKKWCSKIGNEIGIHFIRIGFNFGAPKTWTTGGKSAADELERLQKQPESPAESKDDMTWHDQEFGALKCV
jgi:hypothetical protein